LSHSRINLSVRLKRQNMFIIENIFAELKGNIFQQIIDNENVYNNNKTLIRPLLVNRIFLFYEAEFIQKLIKDKRITETIKRLFSNSGIFAMLLINNSSFANLIPITYPQRTRDKINNRNSFLCLISRHFLKL
jgi:hypothetical protein